MKIYCIGIGGIGLSALARYYKNSGHDVLGSDQADSALLEDLRNEGIHIFLGHHAENIPEDIDMVIYTIAIPTENEELKRAKSLGALCKTYPEALGEITKEKKTIAICGTHGKTTTTAMTYYALRACGVKPTLILGSLLSEGGTNFVAGDSEWMVVEACEYKRSFCNLFPSHVIVTNIDEDHLDYYKDIHDIASAFQEFIQKVEPNGFVATHTEFSSQLQGSHIVTPQVDPKSIELQVLGAHNKKNASLVLTMLMSLGFKEEDVRKGLKEFLGTWRRMEYKGKTQKGVRVYDDYGHHPEEIAVTYAALREAYPKDKNTIVMLFQPHLYSRTKLLFDDFIRVLKEVDMVYILPIYRARLEDTTVTSEDALVSAINDLGGHAQKLHTLGDIKNVIESIEDKNTVVLNIGAGNAFEVVDTVQFA
jgi:UDP-N-acetylmuramate--alanine ligase